MNAVSTPTSQNTAAELPSEVSDLRSRLAEVVAYVGAGLILAAAGVVIGQNWSDLTTAAQVAILATAAAILLIGGLLVGGFQHGIGQARDSLRSDDRSVRRRLASTLLVGGGLSAAFAVGIGLEPELGDEVLLPAAATGLIVALAAWWLTGTVITELALFGAGLATLGGLNNYSDLAEPWPAVIVCAIGLVWAASAITGRLNHRITSQAIGFLVALVTANRVVIDRVDEPPAEWPAFLMLAIVAAAAFTGYVRSRDWPGVVVGLLATVLLVIRVVETYTDGAGTALGIMLAGVVLLVGSWLAWRTRPVPAHSGGEPTGALATTPEQPTAQPGWALPEGSYRAAFAADPAPHAIVGTDRAVIDGNAAMAEALHIPWDDLRGTVLDVLLAEHTDGVQRTALDDGTTLVTLR